jgi:type I restriction enzyme S subunit
LDAYHLYFNKDGTTQNQMNDKYKKTKLGWIPKEWKVVTFDKIVDNNTSKYNKLKGKCIDLQHVEQETGKILGYDDFEGKESNKNHFLEDDILFCKLRPYLKKYWYCEFEGACSSELMVFRAKNTINSKFVFYIIQQESFIENSVSKSYGTKMPRTSWTIVSEYSLRLPPLTEQKKIAQILSTIDAKINNLSDQITETETLKKGLMQQLLTEGIGHSEFKDSKLGRIPKSWEVVSVEDVANVITGNKDTQNKVDGGEYPFYVRSNTIERINSFSFDGEAILTSGDGVGVGKIYHYINEKFDYHQRVYNIHNFKSNTLGKYFFYYFSNHFYGRVSKLSAKNSVDSVRRSMITEMKLPLPPLSEQKEIAKILSTVDAKLDVLRASRKEYEVLKKGMMQVLLTGEVRV